MAEGKRVFSDTKQSRPSGCKKLGKHGSRKRAVRRGQVVSITGDYKGLTTEYVKDIGYDEYAQRVFIEYGNGVKTEYTYDKTRRWLDTIRTQKDMETYQNIEYSFDKVGNVLGYKNDTTYYSTKQNYTYDSLYQLIGAQGKSINKPYGPIDYISNYKQTFRFDTLGMGNMTSKVSSVYNNPDRLLGENINYSLEYEYDRNYAHRVKRIGNRYYSYDENGNVVLEQDEPITAQDEQRYEIQELGENLYGVEYGWALENEEEQNKVGSSSVYKRRYRWNERNLMQESSENRQSVYYRYGADGQRALKSSNQSETLYFNTMWSWLHNSSAYNTERESKHIYLGSERLVTRTNGAGTQGNTYTAQVSTYYYHSDHLGSAQLITDNEGKEYERIEYTPYGEYWIEKRAPENKTLPFKFTGKERDEETGLYYYGVRYLDPKTSRWLSADPALSDYIPMAPVNDEAKKHNQNLPGMGGIYNTVNFHLYHYAGNNPVKYTDPDGNTLDANLFWEETLNLSENLGQADGPYMYGDVIGLAVLGVGVCIVAGINLYNFVNEAINNQNDKKVQRALQKIEIAATSPMPLPPNDPNSKGTRTISKTLYNKNGTRIDVENPGNRSGQIYVQQGKAKYIYDVADKVFKTRTGGELAPKAFQDLLNNPDVIKAIAKGLEYLGY